MMPEWMTEPVLLAIIGGVFSVMIALIGKLTFDVSKTRKDAAAVHQSINNRPTSMSDRIDSLSDQMSGVLKAVGQVQQTQKEHGEKLVTHTRDIRGVRSDIGGLQGADRQLREDVASTNRQLSTHVRETSEWTPMLTELHSEYVDKRKLKKNK